MLSKKAKKNDSVYQSLKQILLCVICIAVINGLIPLTTYGFVSASPDSAVAPVTQNLTPAPRDALILFYTSSCPHCQRFVPLVRQYAVNHDLSVLAYTLDGVSLPEFPDSVTPTQAEIRQFFAKKAPVVPVLFWMDTGSQHILPVLQGEATYSQLTSRMQQLHAVEVSRVDQ